MSDKMNKAEMLKIMRGSLDTDEIVEALKQALTYVPEDVSETIKRLE